MHGLHWSCMARLAAVQGTTANDMIMHRRGCGHVGFNLHFVVSANVQNSHNNLLV